MSQQRQLKIFELNKDYKKNRNKPSAKQKNKKQTFFLLQNLSSINICFQSFKFEV